MNFSITKQQETWIREQVANGDYATASDYVRQAIREKMQRDKLKAAHQYILQKAIAESESDDSQFLDIERLKQEVRSEYSARKKIEQENLKSLIEESLNNGPAEPLEDVETLYRMAREYRASKASSKG